MRSACNGVSAAGVHCTKAGAEKVHHRSLEVNHNVTQDARKMIDERISQRRRHSLRTFRCSVERLEDRRLLVATIVVGNHIVLPNSAGQIVQVFVSGGDAVSGVDFNAQIADGGIFAGGVVSGPAIAADIVNATIFAPNNVGDNNANPGHVFGDMVAFHSTTTASGAVSANGLLATLIIDTTGFASGTWPLKLAGTVNGNTAFGSVPTNVTNGRITIGSFAPGQVVGRHLFYNQSGTVAGPRYDGNNIAINSLDDNAIATDKTAYLWEDAAAATFANISSYSKGINGIMIDLASNHGVISADDFIFRVGNNNAPGTWAAANPPTSISVRSGVGVGGSDRITIIWATGIPLSSGSRWSCWPTPTRDWHRRTVIRPATAILFSSEVRWATAVWAIRPRTPL